MKRLRATKQRLIPVILIALFASVGSYFVFTSRAAPGDVFNKVVYLTIRGNDGPCAGLCFNSSVTSVSFYAVARGSADANTCASIVDENDKSQCNDIITASPLLSCNSYPVTARDVTMENWGTITYKQYGVNGGPTHWNSYGFTLYIFPNSSNCTGERIISSIGGDWGGLALPESNPQNVSIGPGACGTKYAEACPVYGSPPSCPSGTVLVGRSCQAVSNPTCTQNCPGDKTGTSGTQGGSSGSTAKKQTTQPNSIPSAGGQDSQNQSPVEPSPFIDGGKEYQPGSDPDTLGSSATSIGKKFFTGWFVIPTVLVLAASAAAAYWWWRRRKA